MFNNSCQLPRISHLFHQYLIGRLCSSSTEFIDHLFDGIRIKLAQAGNVESFEYPQRFLPHRLITGKKT